MPGIASVSRRHDLDWLRVGALGLLIVTHVTFVYRTTEWRVQSEHAGLWGDLLVEALAPWRMSLVFFIGGAATRFARGVADLFLAGGKPDPSLIANTALEVKSFKYAENASFGSAEVAFSRLPRVILLTPTIRSNEPAGRAFKARPRLAVLFPRINVP